MFCRFDMDNEGWADFTLEKAQLARCQVVILLRNTGPFEHPHPKEKYSESDWKKIAYFTKNQEGEYVSQFRFRLT